MIPCGFKQKNSLSGFLFLFRTASIFTGSIFFMAFSTFGEERFESKKPTLLTQRTGLVVVSTFPPLARKHLLLAGYLEMLKQLGQRALRVSKIRGVVVEW
jgi:hypothetical protein